MKNLCYESTSLCPLKCPYCISSDNGSMEQEHYLEVIDFIGKTTPERLVIGGGEPLVDPLLKEKVLLINKKYKEQEKESYISISTSGACKIKESTWQFLKENIKCLDFSIPSLDHNTYQKMRGVDLLDLALANIKKATQYGINVRLSVVLTKMNVEEIPHLLKLSQAIGVNSVRLGRYFPFRNAYNLKDIYELDEEKILQIITDIQDEKYSSIYKGKIIPPVNSLDMMNAYLNVNFNGEIFTPNQNGKKILGTVNNINIDELEERFKTNQPKLFIKYKEK